jgi:hypothetical protein
MTAVVALLVPVLAACGFSVQTDQVYQAANGSNNRDGQVDVLNAMIVTGTSGSGTLVTTLVNKNQTDSDTLTQVGGDGVTAQGGSISVPAGGSVNLATSKTPIFLQGKRIVPGNFVRLELSFTSGQTTTINVPVMENQGDYSSITQAPSSSSSSSPSPSPSS